MVDCFAAAGEPLHRRRLSAFHLLVLAWIPLSNLILSRLEQD